MTLLFCDLETFGTVDLPKCGAYRYAEEAEVLLFAYAFDEEPATVWDCTSEPMPERLRTALDNPDTITVWHNGGGFDAPVLKHALGIDLPPERMIDTQALALAHALPGALGDLSDVFKLGEDKAKDKRGKQLIQLFCKLQRDGSRATALTHPEEWEQFKEYARLDVEAERELYKLIPQWNNRGHEQKIWQLDQRINRRGVAIDMELVRAAIGTVEVEKQQLAQRAQQMTQGEVEAATQRDAMLAHILKQYGVQLPDLQKATLERRIDDESLPLPLRELLAVRLQASSTSTGKYVKLSQATCTDGRLRGVLQYCGASRTGRWAGRLFQPQNLPRPTLSQFKIDAGIEALKGGYADVLFDNITELASSALRGCIIAAPGKKLVVADLSNIEGRVLAWLAGERWKLDAFRAFDNGTGHDLYALAYAKSFAVTPEAVMDNKKNGDGSWRQIGKVQELALGYEGGVGAFLTFAAAYGIDLEAMGASAYDALPPTVRDEAISALEWTKKQGRTTHGLSDRAWIVCETFKRSWRYAHPQTASLWKELQAGVIKAIEHPKVTIHVRKLAIRKDGNWLRIRLPSGRYLCYPNARIEEGTIKYEGINQYTRKWSVLGTYGGKLTENVVQAIARDVMAANMLAIDEQFPIVLSVHDELITEADDVPENSADRLSEMMATPPEWAADMPLAAAGFEAYRYKKD